MIIFQINISPLQSMIAKLLFIMLIAFYNASESLYKIYNETNYIDNNSGNSKSSMGALLNQILKFSIQSEIAKDPQKILHFFMIFLLDKMIMNFRKIGKKKWMSLLKLKSIN